MQEQRENNILRKKMDKLAKDLLEIAELTVKESAPEGKWEIFRRMLLDKVNDTRRSFSSGLYSYEFDIRKERK